MATTGFTSPRKRSYDGRIVESSPKPAGGLTDDSLPALLSHPARQPSPAPSTASSSLTDLSLSTSQNPSTSTPSAVVAKKRKLTFAERETERTRRQEAKEAKDRRKGEQKARKDEEKRVKDEEKRRKEEEKEAARRAKEFEKAEKQKLKDVEKAKKEEEKTKKDRAQMRIGAFFGVPRAASTPPSTPEDVSSGVSSRRSSLADLDIDVSLLETQPSNQQVLEYEKLFPPFFVFENTEVAPHNRHVRSHHPRVLEELGSEIASCTHDGDKEVVSLSATFRHAHKRRRLCAYRPVKDLVAQINGTSEISMDLRSHSSRLDPVAQIHRLPIKYLFYHTDVRPPYQGTFSRHVPSRSAARLSKNPFYQALPEINYDYESEAEWEEPQDGDDDVNLEDEDSEEEVDEEEMDDFLDDEEDVVRRRMVIGGDMTPICSGICWQDQQHTAAQADLGSYRMDVLDDAHTFPIDPYSTMYWSKLVKSSPVKLEVSPEPISNLMQPPRLPLSTVHVPNGQGGQGLLFASKSDPKLLGPENIAPGTKSAARSKSGNRQAKTIPPEQLPAFKQAVSGSDLTKAGLIEILKKQFPKISKDAIKDTLTSIASRQGVKEVDKKWILI